MTLDDMIAQWAADHERPLLRASVRGMERLLLSIDDDARRMAKAIELMGRDGPQFLQFMGWHADQARRIGVGRCGSGAAGDEMRADLLATGDWELREGRRLRIKVTKDWAEVIEITLSSEALKDIDEVWYTVTPRNAPLGWRGNLSGYLTIELIDDPAAMRALAECKTDRPRVIVLRGAA